MAEANEKEIEIANLKSELAMLKIDYNTVVRNNREMAEEYRLLKEEKENLLLAFRATAKLI